MSISNSIYFKEGKLLYKINNVKIYSMQDELFLEIGKGHSLWTTELEFNDTISQLGDFPKGNCLEIGLGLSIISRYILTFPKVKHLTTIESNNDVIKINKIIKEKDRKLKLPYNKKNHLILNTDVIEYAYLTKQKYDFIFINCYNVIDEETLPLIADINVACNRMLNPHGKIIAWVDKHTSGEHYTEFKKIMNRK